MNDFQTAFSSFIKECQELQNHWHVANKNAGDPALITFEEGRKFIRVVRNQYAIRSAYCFVNKQNGDVLKAASWKVPAKHARGNIFDEHNGIFYMGPFGAAYLR